MPVATFSHPGGSIDWAVAPAALSSGAVLELPNGRVGVYTAARPAASGDTVALQTKGIADVALTASMVVLNGTRLYYDRATNKATIKYVAGCFFIGCAVKDAAANDATVKVEINVEQCNVTELGRWELGGGFENSDALGLGTTFAANGLATLAMDAVAEIARASMKSVRGVKAADGPIAELELAVFDIGDHADLDINFGLATELHATNFDSSAAYVALHLDGADLSLNLQSDDGTTPVTATDTTVDVVDDTYYLYQFDLRDLADIKVYRDGVLLSGATLHLNAFTGTLYLVVHLEKGSNDTTADVRVRDARLRTTDLAA